MTNLMTNISMPHPQLASESADIGQNADRRLCRQRIWLVLPAYNEEQSLPALLDNVEEAMLDSGLEYRVVIVDDGSRDRTAEIIREYAKRMPIHMEQHPVNMGLGATIRDGLLKAAELCSPRDVIVTMDADNSHAPGLIDRMARMVAEGNDVVIASRYREGSMTRGVPPLRLLFSSVAGLLFRVLLPIPGVRDYTCGFRAYRGSVMKEVAEKYGAAFFDQQGFQCMVDILLKLRRNRNLVFGEVPMILRYDRKEGASKMRVGRTITSTLKLMLKRRLEG